MGWLGGLMVYNFKGAQAFCKGAQVLFFKKINLLKKKIWARRTRTPLVFVPDPAKLIGKQKQNKINNNSTIQKPNGKKPRWKTKE